MFQQHVPDILFIYFDARVHKYELGKKNSLVFVSKITAFAFIVLAKLQN